MANNILTKSALQDMMDISQATVDRLVKDGVLQPYTFPGRRKIYFKRDEVVSSLRPIKNDDTIGLAA